MPFAGWVHELALVVSDTHGTSSCVKLFVNLCLGAVGAGDPRRQNVCCNVEEARLKTGLVAEGRRRTGSVSR